MRFVSVFVQGLRQSFFFQKVAMTAPSDAQRRRLDGTRGFDMGWDVADGKTKPPVVGGVTT
jgi:hypothetical protein